MDKFSPAALAYAIEQSKKDSKPLFELVDKNKKTDSLIRGKSKGVKHIQLSVLQPIIDKYPPFLTYLEEGESARRESAASPTEGSDIAMLLRDLKEGQIRLERGLALVADRVEHTRKYIELLENGVAPPPPPTESEGKTG